MDRQQGRTVSGAPDAPFRHAPDQLLVRRALAGEGRSVSMLVQRLAGLKAILHRLNCRMGKPLGRDDLDDVHQEVWVRIWMKLDSYEGRGSLEAWARRFGIFVFMNRLRRAARERELERSLPEERIPDESTPRGDEFLVIIERLLDDLGSPEAEIIRLKHLQSLSFAGIAKELQIPLSTAKSRYYRGLGWLRNHLPMGESGPQPSSISESLPRVAHPPAAEPVRRRFESRRQ